MTFGEIPVETPGQVPETPPGGAGPRPGGQAPGSAESVKQGSDLALEWHVRAFTGPQKPDRHCPARVVRV